MMMQQSCGRSRRGSPRRARLSVPARAGICDGPQLICIWHEQTCRLFSLLPELRSAGCRFKAESSYLGQIFGLFLKDMSVANKKVLESTVAIWKGSKK